MADPTIPPALSAMIGELRHRQDEEIREAASQPHATQEEIALLQQVHRREAEIVAHAEIALSLSVPPSDPQP